MDDSSDADEEEALVNNNRQDNGNGINDSDEDSDFTSVSQRAPNPQYYGNAYNQGGYQPQNQYSHVQQYTPIHQQQQLQANQYRPYMGQQPQPHQLASGPAYAGSNASAPTSSYYSNLGQPSPYQQQQYHHQSQSQSQPQPPRGPTVSDNVLNNNPDFQFARLQQQQQQQRRKANPGFVPVAARYNGAPLGQKSEC